jgi:hypothetical protein
MNTLLIFLLALLIQPAPAPFAATWQRPGIARLSWTQLAGVRETCVIRAPAAGISVLVGCWYDLPAGPTGLTLGASAPVDASFRPTAGDTFTLTMDGAASTAQLRGVVYLGVMRR